MLCWSVPSRAMERWNLKVITGVAAVAVLAVSAALSRVQIKYWRDSQTLFRRALDVTRDNWLVHDNLGVILTQAGKMQEAMQHLEQAVRIKPDFAEAHYNLGTALSQVGRIDEAIAHYEQALRIKPDFAEAHYNLGNALTRLGRFGSHRTLRAGPADQSRLCQGARQLGDRLDENGQVRRGDRTLRAGAADQARLRRGALQPWECLGPTGQAAGSDETLGASAAEQTRLRRGGE